MSRFLLIRHATTTAMKETLYGRRAGYDLSEGGQMEAAEAYARMMSGKAEFRVVLTM